MFNLRPFEGGILAYWVHDLDPVILPIYGNLAIRWYGLSYVAGFLIAWWLLSFYSRRGRCPWDAEQRMASLVRIAIGILVGGRLGYMLLYDLSSFTRNPLSLFYIWEGGMASHGGFIGCAVAVYFVSKTSSTPFLRTSDLVVTLASPGIFLGRIANFINGELWGRITDLPWAVIFPQSAPPGTALDQIPPRHPSQLYEAALEGLVLFAYIQFRFWKRGRLPARPAGGIPDGQLSGEFLVAYAALRILGELFREPDPAGLILGLSRGTFYSLILGLVGLCWIFAVRWAGRGDGGETDRGEAIGRKASS